MLEAATNHHTHNVLAAANDYYAAEQELTRAYNTDRTPASWEAEARTAKRRAAEIAISIDGLADRCHHELGISLTEIRNAVSALCVWPGTNAARIGCLPRVRGVANAYKHENLSDPNLPIASDADVLVVGAGYGIDGFGVGKPGGVEVLVRETGGDLRKFSGDAPVAIAAWFKYLAAKGATISGDPVQVCGVQVHP